MSQPSDYGDRYWCVKTALSKDGEVYLHADFYIITQAGDLHFIQHKDGPEPRMSFAAGHWIAVYAASVIDGSPVCVVHWKGEVSA